MRVVGGDAPRRTVGESATARATATARSVAASRASRRASYAASAIDGDHEHDTTPTCSSRTCRATELSAGDARRMSPRIVHARRELNDQNGDPGHMRSQDAWCRVSTRLGP